MFNIDYVLRKIDQMLSQIIVDHEIKEVYFNIFNNIEHNYFQVRVEELQSSNQKDRNSKLSASKNKV